MRNEFLDEMGDTIFAIAIAAAIGLVAANLAVQAYNERAVLDAAGVGHENVSTSEGASHGISPAG